MHGEILNDGYFVKIWFMRLLTSIDGVEAVMPKATVI